MVSTKRHFTLRELHAIAVSPRLWLTFALVVALFTVIGPFGTGERMFVGMRFAYWLILHAIAWSISITFAVITDVYLPAGLGHRALRTMTGSLIAALPVALSLQGLGMAFEGHAFSAASLASDFSITLPLCALFCLLTWLTMSDRLPPETALEKGAAPLQTGATATEPAPLLLRLNPANRAALLRLSSDDHYTEVVTRRGRELVLIRFTDALAELGTTPGLRVHRSHWVADEHVLAARREAGRLVIVAIDGERIPVSRTYEADVRQRFGKTIRD